MAVKTKLSSVLCSAGEAKGKFSGFRTPSGVRSPRLRDLMVASLRAGGRPMTTVTMLTTFVIPAKAGNHCLQVPLLSP
ncbi:hypothetical protein BPTFM16_00227 [Altererythrobacter insulae]|nr:hypothetical protein BPTFM16_00227 [Altererythrobacter insulae]